MPFDYTTSAAVFAYGGSAGTATDPVDEAAVMAELVTAMSRAVDTYCNQQFSQAIYTDQILPALIDADGVLTCYPPVPVMDVPTAAAWRMARTTTWAALSLLDVEPHAFGCVLRALDSRLLHYRGARLNARLSYTGGWADIDAVPDDFAWAMRALCWWAYQKRSAPGDATAIPDLGALVVPSSWPAHIVQLFRNYVRAVVM